MEYDKKLNRLLYNQMYYEANRHILKEKRQKKVLYNSIERENEKLNIKIYNQMYYKANKEKWKHYKQTQLNDPIKREALRKYQRMWAKNNYIPKTTKKYKKQNEKHEKNNKKKKKNNKIEKVDTFESFENYKQYLNL